MAARLALLQYIERTNTKLSLARNVDAEELKSKILPSVVESIRRLSAGAPPAMKHQLEAFLMENAVLPDFAADTEAFKRSLRSIYKFLNSELEKSQRQHACGEPRSPILLPEKALEKEGLPAQATPEVLQNVKVQLEDAQLSKQAVNSTSCKQRPHVSQSGSKSDATEQPKSTARKEDQHKQRAMPEDVQGPNLHIDQGQPRKETAAQSVATIHAEDHRIDTKPSTTLDERENDEKYAKSSFHKEVSQSRVDPSARSQLLNYVDSTLSRLETNGNIGGTQLKTKVLPSVISSIERLSSTAPVEIKTGIKDILQKSGLVPIWAADLESLKKALEGVKSFIADELQKRLSAPCQIQTSLGHPLRGISVEYLSTAFLDELKAHGFDRNAKVYEVEPTVIRGKGRDTTCPRDGKTGAAYIDCLRESDAGMSTHMLSYTWGYEIGDIVDSLLAFCNNQKVDPKHVFVWICCLCINQHRVIEARERGDVVPFEQFKDAFGHRVSSIGHIVAMMSPWKDPSYTKRVWCDFEMYTAASLGEDVCKISVTMPPRESDDMRMTLMSGGASNHELWEALQNVKIEEAQASVQEDKERILKLIEDTIGFHALNSTVTKCLQSWVAATCQEIFDELPKDSTRSEEEVAKTAASVGYVLRDVGKMEKAHRVLSEAQDLFTEAGILNTHDGAMLLSNLGATSRRCGDLDNGLELLNQAQEIFERTGTLETLAGAMMYNSLGAAKRQASDLAGAFDAYESAHAILKSIGQLDTSEGASLMNSYGALKRQTGDLEGALQAFHIAEEILHSSGKMCSPAGHMLMNSIAAAKKSKNDMLGALKAYEYGRHIVERIGTLETDNGVSLLINIGAAKRKIRDLQGAWESFTAARDICKKMDTLHTSEGKNLLNTVAHLEADMKKQGGNVRGAKQTGGRTEQDGNWRSSGDAGKSNGNWRSSGDADESNGSWRSSGDAGKSNANWRSSGDAGESNGNWRSSGDAGKSNGSWRSSGDAGKSTGNWRSSGDEGEGNGNWRSSGDAGKSNGSWRSSGDAGKSTGNWRSSGDAGESNGNWRSSGDTGKSNGKGCNGKSEDGKGDKGKGQNKGGKGDTGRRLSEPGRGYYGSKNNIATEGGKGYRGKGKGASDLKDDVARSSILGQASPLRRARTDCLGNTTDVVEVLA